MQGFPKDCVFVYEGQDLTGVVDWSIMKPWHAGHAIEISQAPI
jgi:hypothetical protein